MPSTRASGRGGSLRATGDTFIAADVDRPRDNPASSCNLWANERLYEAYSELHCLAQDFEKPFDAPAILVVGHQTDGKSSLVEGEWRVAAALI